MNLNIVGESTEDRRKKSQTRRAVAGFGVGVPGAILLGWLNTKYNLNLTSTEISGLGGVITAVVICAAERLERFCNAIYKLIVLYIRSNRR